MGVRSVKLDPAAGFSALQNPADFPALAYWFRLGELAGEAALNYGNATLPGGELSLVGEGPHVKSGGGVVISKEVGARSALRCPARFETASPEAAIISGKSVVIFADFDPPIAPKNGDYLFCYGRASTTTSRGVRITLDGNANPRLTAIGPTGTSAAKTLSNLGLATGRRRLVMIWDRLSTSIGIIRGWAQPEGGSVVALATNTLDADPGSIVLSATTDNAARVTIGHLANSDGTPIDTPMSVIVHQVQMWAVTALPDPETLALQILAQPYRLPDIMNGVT